MSLLVPETPGSSSQKKQRLGFTIHNSGEKKRVRHSCGECFARLQDCFFLVLCCFVLLIILEKLRKQTTNSPRGNARFLSKKTPLIDSTSRQVGVADGNGYGNMRTKRLGEPKGLGIHSCLNFAFSSAQGRRRRRVFPDTSVLDRPAIPATPS